MTRYAVLLRGINVGGKHPVSMPRLRAILTEAGFDDVASYINSGNIVLGSSLTAPKVEDRVAELIRSEFGFDVAIMVRDGADVRGALDANPYPDGNPAQTTIWFAKSTIPMAQRRAAGAVQPAGSERFRVSDREVFIDFGGRISDSKLSEQLQKVITVEMTARNLRTVTRIVELLG